MSDSNVSTFPRPGSPPAPWWSELVKPQFLLAVMILACGGIWWSAALNAEIASLNRAVSIMQAEVLALRTRGEAQGNAIAVVQTASRLEAEAARGADLAQQRSLEAMRERLDRILSNPPRPQTWTGEGVDLEPWTREAAVSLP